MPKQRSIALQKQTDYLNVSERTKEAFPMLLIPLFYNNNNNNNIVYLNIYIIISINL